MGGRFPRSSSWQAYPFAGAVPSPYGALAPWWRSWRFSCSDGHSVVIFATFLLLDFGLCMRKEKADTKNRPRIFSAVGYVSAN